MWDLLALGFLNVSSPLTFVLIAVGVAVGIVFGAVPGLMAVMAIALCLPMTYELGAAAGISLLIALWVGATCSTLISTILLEIPGTPSAIATIFDGGPIMEKGEGAKALGAGIVFSFIGTILSIGTLMFIAPSLATVALSFGPHEYFAIAVFSLTLIATHSSGSMNKGVFSGVLGFAISTVGIAPDDATALHLRPGRAQLRLQHPDGAALTLSALLMLILEFHGLRIFIKLLAIPKHVLLPVILVLCTVGGRWRRRTSGTGCSSRTATSSAS